MLWAGNNRSGYRYVQAYGSKGQYRVRRPPYRVPPPRAVGPDAGVPPQVEHGNMSTDNKWASTQKFDDPADAALLAAKYTAGILRGLPTGWVEDGLQVSTDTLEEFEGPHADPE